MTDDIVTRLRAAYKNADEVASVFLTNEAANEIERLQKLTSELAQLMMPFALLIDAICLVDDEGRTRKSHEGGA